MQEQEWTIQATIASEATDDLEAIADDVLDVLGDHSPAVSYEPGRFGVVLSVDALDIGHALDSARYVLQQCFDKIHPSAYTIIELAGMTVDEADRRLAEPTVPELIGVAELATKLGVSRQRASELARSETFPQPLAMLASGPVWAAPMIGHFVEQWDRRPGRKRTTRKN